jgi:hypothetical protein
MYALIKPSSPAMADPSAWTLPCSAFSRTCIVYWLYVCMHVLVFMCMYVYVCVYAHKYPTQKNYVCMYVYIYIYIYTYAVYTDMCKQQFTM